MEKQDTKAGNVQTCNHLVGFALNVKRKATEEMIAPSIAKMSVLAQKENNTGHQNMVFEGN